MELEAAFGEAEGALEEEENKVLSTALELTQVNQEVAHRIARILEKLLREYKWHWNQRLKVNLKLFA